MRVRIKICGITTVADAQAAAELGADAIGLNFYASSPRYIEEGVARQIVQELPPLVEPVALFVNVDGAEAERIAHGLHIRTIQMHGDHGTRWPAGATRWIPAFALRDQAGLAAIEQTVTRIGPIAALLVDAHVSGLFGGTGQVAPWHLLADYRPKKPLILAGGLTPENVAEAIRIVRPYAVDVASGVEKRPGVKDLDKMRRFIDAVRAASF